MEHIKQRELLQRTLMIWQPRAERDLSEEDARQIVENMAGFFRVLAEWQQRAAIVADERASAPHVMGDIDDESR